MTTRAIITADAAGYLHRNDLTTQLDAFFDRANTRVGQDFRTQANAQSATLITGTSYLLPADFKEMISVFAQGPAGFYPLQPVGTTQLWDYFNAGGGLAYGYQLIGGYLQPVPSVTGDLRILYYSAQAMAPASGPTSTNLLCQTYPNAYLWYVLFQASLYIQDREAVSEYLELYQDEMRRANAVNRQKLQPISSVQGTTGTVAVAT